MLHFDLYKEKHNWPKGLIQLQIYYIHLELIEDYPEYEPTISWRTMIVITEDSFNIGNIRFIYKFKSLHNSF